MRKSTAVGFSVSVFTIDSVSPGTHSVYIVAYNKYERSGKSNTVSITVASQSSAPTLYSAVQIGTAIGNTGKVQLDWQYLPNAPSYCIYRSTGGAWTQVWSGVGTYTLSGTTITGVQTTVSCPKGTYLFAVTSCNPGESGKSKSKLVTVK